MKLSKYILLLIGCFVFILNVTGQRNKAEYELKITGSLQSGNRSMRAKCTQAHLSISRKVNNIRISNDFHDKFEFDSNSSWDIPDFREIVEYDDIYDEYKSSFEVSDSRNISGNCGKNKETGGSTVDITSIYGDCITTTNDNPFSSNTMKGSVQFNVAPYLNNALVQPLIDNSFPVADSIKILGPIGFPSSVYRWQFSFDNNNWIDFPSEYIGKDSLFISASDMLNNSGINVYDKIGHPVFIRLNGNSCNQPSNRIIYIVNPSAPRVNNVTTASTTCFDNNDGKIEIFFKTPLKTGELLTLNLFASNGALVDSYQNIDLDSLTQNNSYKIPLDISPGKYIIKFFTLLNSVPSGLRTLDTITITAPLPVAFTTTNTNVWCNGGSDGIIQPNATGGVGNYQYMIKRQGEPDSLWYNFSAATSHNISGLPQGTYLVQIRDGNQCYAKASANGPIVTTTVTLTQPATPLLINEVQKVNPTAFGFANGYIITDISGGTGNADGSYNYEWKRLNGTVISSGITASVNGSAYRIRLDNLADDTYILNVTDRNKNSATTTQGCMATDTFVITQPLPLKVKIAIRDSILCNNDANGTLIAHAQGGIQFATPALPYLYTWKKKDATNTYQVMAGYTDSIAGNLSTGWYAVNITDANSVSLTSDSIFFLSEPLQLMVNLSKNDITCSGLPNGAVASTVSGGTIPYSYNWNTGETTTAINNVPAGTYLLWVEDYHGCEAQKNIVVSQPNDIILDVTKQSPTCNNGTDGFINVAVNGGTSPFVYNWTGSASTSNIASNLRGGNYSLKIIDANGCNIIHNDTLANPDPLPLDLGPDRYICSSQQMEYDITIPSHGLITYTWTSNVGFSSNQPKVILSQAGTYYATVKDADNCTSTDMLVLTAINTKVDNEFALPTQGYPGEKIVIANLSVPQADSVKWTFPANATILSQDAQIAEMTLKDTGTYYVSLRTYKGLCYADQKKKIIINQPTTLPDPGSARNPFIVSFSAAPIPNMGNFTVKVELQEAAQIELKLINVVTSQIITLGRQSGFSKYSIPVNVPLSSGTYVLLLETPKGRETIKVLIL